MQNGCHPKILLQDKVQRLTFSAGFVENLSFRAPFSSNINTSLSVVQIASFLAFGAQHTAVTFTIPVLGGVKDSI
jgi:hypothetical protein